FSRSSRGAPSRTARVARRSSGSPRPRRDQSVRLAPRCAARPREPLFRSRRGRLSSCKARPQKGDRRRGDTGYARGLPDRARAMPFELLRCLRGKPREPAINEAWRNATIPRTLESTSRLLLPLEEPGITDVLNDPIEFI